jgi:hypothetical protein
MTLRKFSLEGLLTDGIAGVFGHFTHCRVRHVRMCYFSNFTHLFGTRMNTPTPFFKLVSSHQNNILNHYRSQLYQQRVLLGLVKSALPDTLKDHARHCVVTGNKVLVYTESAVWASQLRFFTNTMLSTILSWQRSIPIASLQIRLLTLTPEQTIARHPKIPSAPTIKLLCEARVHQQDALSQALTALSNTLDKKFRQANTASKNS